jgi:Zn-dependent protease/CBS domain-containing protein
VDERVEEEAAPGSPSRPGISLFPIRGIDVRLDYSWFLIFLLILISLSAGYFPMEHPGEPVGAYWVAGLVSSLLFFLSILAHELSHAFVAQLSGIRVPSITLFLFGGVSQMESEARRPASEMSIAAVGPLTSFVLAAAFWALHRLLPADASPLVGAVVAYLAWINAALGVFNLLPGFPLDGGRVLRAVLWWKTGSLRRATRLSADAGKGLAIGMIVLGGFQIFSGALLGGLWLILIAMFLRSVAEGSYQNLVMTQVLEGARVGDVAIRDPISVPAGLTIEELVDRYLLEYGYRGYAVVEEDGRPVGIVSIADLKGLPPERRRETTVRDRMRRLDEELRVTPELPVRDALKKLGDAPDGRLLVIRGGRLLGMLTRNALARSVEIRQALEQEAS